MSHLPLPYTVQQVLIYIAKFKTKLLYRTTQGEDMW